VSDGSPLAFAVVTFALLEDDRPWHVVFSPNQPSRMKFFEFLFRLFAARFLHNQESSVHKNDSINGYDTYQCGIAFLGF
jgi:hypothetical protein